METDGLGPGVKPDAAGMIAGDEVRFAICLFYTDFGFTAVLLIVHYSVASQC